MPYYGGGEAIGWLAALVAMLGFGSFGVPIKSDAANSVDIDPLVMQSYKSGVCFLTSWFILLNPSVEFSYTPWGIVSCIFWVPGGVAAVYAIRNAGLAIAIGVGSSTIVLVSFIWGIFIFDEDIHSKWGASLAVAMMMSGLAGMSYYSSPVVIQQTKHDADGIQSVAGDGSGTEFLCMTSMRDEGEGILKQRQRPPKSHQIAVNNTDDTTPIRQPVVAEKDTASVGLFSTARAEIIDSLSIGGLERDNFDDEYRDPLQPSSQSLSQPSAARIINPLERIHVCGITLTRRQLGISGALFNGIWGGSIMAPMKLAKHTSSGNTQGVHYLISFGIGAAIVTTALWILRFANNLVYYQGSPSKAYRALPSFHFKVMWCAGGTSGLLWSMGNFFSLISVHYLGQGVGYSVVQAGMLVSGLWGIFYFHEITGHQTIAKWLVSACVTICGIIWLSYEHHKKAT